MGDDEAGLESSPNAIRFFLLFFCCCCCWVEAATKGKSVNLYNNLGESSLELTERSLLSPISTSLPRRFRFSAFFLAFPTPAEAAEETEGEESRLPAAEEDNGVLTNERPPLSKEFHFEGNEDKLSFERGTQEADADELVNDDGDSMTTPWSFAPDDFRLSEIFFVAASEAKRLAKKGTVDAVEVLTLPQSNFDVLTFDSGDMWKNPLPSILTNFSRVLNVLSGGI